MIKLQQKIFTIISFVFSIWFIYFLLSRRVFKTIFDIYLLNIAIDKKATLLSFFIVALVISLVILFMLLFSGYTEFIKKNDDSFKLLLKSPFIYILKIFVTIENLLLHTYTLVFEYIGPNKTIYLIFFTKYCIKKSNYFKQIIVFGEVLPRIIIIIVFIVELFILKHLHYYFISLILLLIPLLFRFILFVLKDLGPRVLPELRKHLQDLPMQETTIIINNQMKRVGIQHYVLKPEYEHLGLDYFMNNFYYPLRDMSSFLETTFLPLHKKIKFITLISYFFIHVIGWTYVLYLILN